MFRPADPVRPSPHSRILSMDPPLQYFHQFVKSTMVQAVDGCLKNRHATGEDPCEAIIFLRNAAATRALPSRQPNRRREPNPLGLCVTQAEKCCWSYRRRNARRLLPYAHAAALEVTPRTWKKLSRSRISLLSPGYRNALTRVSLLCHVALKGAT
jgi:hypothetical protein